MKFKTLLKSYPRTFWVANTIELFERWGWYGFYMLLANYLTRSTDLGGLGFSQSQKGWIMGFGVAILYFLPIFTGSFADKFGYRKTLFISFLIYISAFLAFPYFDTYAGVFIVFIYLAFGAALFKPIISATVAKTTNEENSSVGFGIFYMMVNLGAYLGPLFALIFAHKGFVWVSRISAVIIAINFIFLLFYKEPDKIKEKKSFREIILPALEQMIMVLRDFRFVIFLLIIAGFWAMYYQLFLTLPVFIEQWVDTQNLYDFFAKYWPAVNKLYAPKGELPAEFVTNFDALYIVLLQIPVSAWVMRWKPLNAMTTGFVVNAIGMGLTFLTQNVIFLLISLLVFGIGEMMGSPKITEYIGKIAPRDKKALYMGYSFLPVFFGSILAGIISGPVYESLSDKHSLVVHELESRNILIHSDMKKNEVFQLAMNKLNMTESELTNYLWQNYQPNQIWMVILGIGFLAALLLWIYHSKIETNDNKQQ